MSMLASLPSRKTRKEGTTLEKISACRAKRHRNGCRDFPYDANPKRKRTPGDEESSGRRLEQTGRG
jgi:hypothetical protein